MEITDIGSGNNFAIGSIIVEPGRNILSHGSDVFPLEPKIMDVLEYLAVRQGQVCSRDDIITTVWKVEYGADESLTRAISVIRKTLRQAGGKGRYIQTISKRGYSLQEPISQLAESKPKHAILTERPVAREQNVTPTALADHQDSYTAVTTSALAPPKKLKLKSLGLILGLLVMSSAAVVVSKWPQSSESFGGELAISPYGRSVAVMPFVDLSVDKTNQYFSDGMAEELSNELRKIETLRIVGQRLGGVSDYKNMSYEELGDKLRVSHIIHGSVRKQDEKVRITAQLINTDDNSHVWSSNYDGTLDDVFDLQQRVASDIVLELTLVLSLNISEPIELEGILPTTLMPSSK